VNRLSFDECWDTFKDWDERFKGLRFTDTMSRPVQTYSELRLFYPYIEALKPRNILEIGSGVGGTLRFWVNAAEDDAKIITVERNPDAPKILPVWERWLNAEQKIFLVNKDSLKEKEAVLNEVAEILGGEKLDFLFIDGTHDFPYFKSDFETYSPLVRGGGVIAFHDIAPRPLNTCVDLANYWARLKVKIVDNFYANTLDIIGRHRTTGCCGIGVIFLDEEVPVSREFIERTRP